MNNYMTRTRDVFSAQQGHTRLLVVDHSSLRNATRAVVRRRRGIYGRRVLPSQDAAADVDDASVQVWSPGVGQSASSPSRSCWVDVDADVGHRRAAPNVRTSVSLLPPYRAVPRLMRLNTALSCCYVLCSSSVGILVAAITITF